VSAALATAGAVTRRTLRDELMLNLRALRARIYVRVVGSMREPVWIVTDTIFPNLGMCAFVLLYRALGAPREYEALAVIGGILSTYWMNVLWGMGAQFYWEKQQGQLQLYFVAPCSRMTILTGMALGGALMTTLRSVAGIALGFFVFHIRLAPFDPGLLLLVFLVTMAALYAIGMTFTSLFLLFGRRGVARGNRAPGAGLLHLRPLLSDQGTRAVRGGGRRARAAHARRGRAAPGAARRRRARALARRDPRPRSSPPSPRCSWSWRASRSPNLEALSKREGKLTQRWQ
jgi:hypothetical protein